MSSKKNTLFAEFDIVSKKEWLEKVEKDLKGKPLSSLNWEWENMEFSPFFHKEDSQTEKSPLKKSNSWLINQDIPVSDARKANKEALRALAGGCTSISFHFESSRAMDLEDLLSDIQLEWIMTQFLFKEEDTIHFEKQLSELISSRKYKAQNVRVGSNREINIRGIQFYPIYDAHESGMEGDQKLLRYIQKSTPQSVLFNISMDDHYYANICRIRALKRLLQEWKIEHKVQAQISPANSQGDDNFRFIQSNAQALAAVIGGADIVSVNNPEADNFQNRINRNISHLLELESYMARVGDPSAGSYFLEHMTQKIYDSYIDGLENS